MSQTARKFEQARLLREGSRMLATWEHGMRKHRVQVLLLEAQCDRCLNCDGLMLSAYRYPQHADRWTIDHVWPRGAGGYDGPGNYAMMHSRCNNRKADRFPSRALMDKLEDLNARLGWPTRRLLWPLADNDG